jgi:phosphoserine phosphatase
MNSLERPDEPGRRTGILFPQGHGVLKMNAAEALAEAWASIDGKAEQFKSCKADSEAEDLMGFYEGYLADAQEMIKRLQDRGYKVVPASSPFSQGQEKEGESA